ncbi:hypothetical protein BHE90_011339 [Fusarium euwallaceae]|uniref:Uncharacterized protein n=1 Tax=Fusarium euwallaceae TaxID=1147111 RepID=A0A430LER4_9HYPO|nr:hypothetical protein BHE90_011339 [Fusarium euwallaceae]
MVPRRLSARRGSEEARCAPSCAAGAPPTSSVAGNAQRHCIVMGHKGRHTQQVQGVVSIASHITRQLRPIRNSAVHALALPHFQVSGTSMRRHVSFFSCLAIPIAF